MSYSRYTSAQSALKHGGEMIEPFNMFRYTICLYCGRVFPCSGGKIHEHVYRVHNRKYAVTGRDCLIFTKFNDRYVFYMRTSKPKKTRIVTENDEKYGEKVKIALELLRRELNEQNTTKI